VTAPAIFRQKRDGWHSGASGRGDGSRRLPRRTSSVALIVSVVRCRSMRRRRALPPPTNVCARFERRPNGRTLGLGDIQQVRRGVLDPAPDDALFRRSLARVCTRGPLVGRDGAPWRIHVSRISTPAWPRDPVDAGFCCQNVGRDHVPRRIQDSRVGNTAATRWPLPHAEWYVVDMRAATMTHSVALAGGSVVTHRSIPQP